MVAIEPRAKPPRRRDQVLSGAIELFRTRGFHAVGIDEIGAAAGISGPGVYRHFPNKNSLLVAIFDAVAVELLDGAERILSAIDDDRQALIELVEFHVDFAVANRSIIAVYYQEQRNLPESDRRRVRRTQRAYLNHWAALVGRLHPAMSGDEALAVVQAAIGVITSITMYDSKLDAYRLRSLVAQRAQLVLLAPEAEPGGA